MSSIYIDETPDSVKSAKGLHLITQNTPNGQKTQILLEELKLLYGLSWTTNLLDIWENVQKQDWFLRLNPNGRIPALIDNTSTAPFPVIESAAQLIYLAKHYDTKHVFLPTDPLKESETLQWLFFWHGGGGPIQGQVNHFSIYAKEKIPYAISRYRNETLRVYSVLEARLAGARTSSNEGQPREYLAGEGEKGSYSIADIGTWPWVKNFKSSGFSDEDMRPFPYLLQWVERIAGREAVQIGIGGAYKKDGNEKLFLGKK